VAGAFVGPVSLPLISQRASARSDPEEPIFAMSYGHDVRASG
jgi:hypothetical protein